jgi:hypothetical protein
MDDQTIQTNTRGPRATGLKTRIWPRGGGKAGFRITHAPGSMPVTGLENSHLAT